MKKKNRFNYVLLAGLLCLSLLYACQPEDIINKEEPEKEPEKEPSISTDADVNKWIETKMRDYYLWYDEMPRTSALDYKLGAEKFFNSLLSLKDGKHTTNLNHYYSWIEKNKNYKTKNSIDPESTYGFEFSAYLESANSTVVEALVTYVLPNSPAETAGLKRGDWISKIGGVKLNTSNYTNLLTGGATTFTLKNATITIEAARAVEDSPFLLSKVIQANGYNIGYLVYNHFSSGPANNSDIAYDNKMREIFAKFKSDDVKEFVLDLRYNGGGLVTSAQLLATMLAPVGALDDVFCNVIYNDKHPENNEVIHLNKSVIKSGQNLNLSRLYVLVSRNSASASEAVINGLRPFMDVFLIGEQTEGKNVGSIHLEDDKYPWALQPIVCHISNKEKKADYANGFTPDAEIKDFELKTPYLPLGDPNELLLKAAIARITGNVKGVSKSETSVASISKELFYSSPDRKKTNGIIIVPRQ